ncbi:MAG: ABC transporter permease [Actinobacteria bacterium]|nr:ABC transporter permease [Actinomycetota bacterium]
MLLVAFLVTIGVFGALRPSSFLTVDNLKSILTQAAPLMVVAVGLTVVLTMQLLDLSFASTIGLCGALAIVLMSQHGISWQLAVLIALAAGAACGLLNGILVSYFGGTALIITLATGTIFTGVEFAVTGQQTIIGGVPLKYGEIANHTALFGLTNQVYIAAVIAVLGWLLLAQTEFGRYMHAIGGNQEAARLSGIRTRELKALGFVIVGLGAAVAGILLTSSASSSTPQVGAPYLLPAFAAVFLGSAVFKLGQFNMPGTVIGVLFLGVIQTGLTMLNLTTDVIYIVQGSILVVAVLLSRIGSGSTA